MNFDWRYTAGLLFDPDFWEATWLVVQLSLQTWLLGIALGFLLATGKQSRNRLLSAACSLYIWFFRSLPLLVLLIFVFNLPQVFPATAVWLNDPYLAGLLALVMSESAYIAEIHRGGLLAVPKGQVEAGKALGIRYLGVQRLIVVPQALRIALPTLVNEYITIVKLTSLVSVISLTEILMVGERLYTRNFKVLETMLAVAFYYVMIVTVFGWLLKWLENALDVQVQGRRARLLPAQADAIPSVLPTGRSVEHVMALQARGVVKRYGDHEVLSGVDLDVKPGEVVSILGPSGSGKTSLIRTFNGLETLDGGSILLHGQPFLAHDGSRALSAGSSEHMHRIVDIGMVFQNFNLFPHRTVLDNLMLAPLYHGRGGKALVRDQALWLLQKVGLRAHAEKYPHQLSGGQQQRVAIARALAMAPSVMLFDEPTSALDPEMVGEVLAVIEGLAREGMTMVIVTHEMNFAFRISDRIVFMEHGVISLQGTPGAVLAQAQDSRFAGFVKDVRLDARKTEENRQ